MTPLTSAEFFVDALDQFGRRRPAATEVLDAGGVAGGEVGTVDELPGHRGHAGERRGALPLDELEGPLGIPAVHQDESAAGRGDRVQAAVAAGDVEERHGQNRTRVGLATGLVGPGRRLAGSDGLGLGGVGHDLPERQVQQVGDGTAVREHGALGMAGGARGVEDADVVLGRDVGQGRRVAGGGKGVVPVDGVVGQASS